MKFVENELDVKTYLELRASVHWKVLLEEQAELALKNSLYTLVVYEDGIAVGMGRIVGDGAVICYVQDLVIRPEYHKRGIGGALLDRLKAYVDALRIPGSVMMFDLMCAKGREDFYEKHDFIARPTSALGPGMIQYLKDK